MGKGKERVGEVRGRQRCRKREKRERDEKEGEVNGRT